MMPTGASPTNTNRAHDAAPALAIVVRHAERKISAYLFMQQVASSEVANSFAKKAAPTSL
jgi:hypothetical protein